MNSPPMVGVACLSRCRRRTAGESLLIGSRKRRAEPGDQPRAQQHGQQEADHGRQRRRGG